MKLSPSFVEDLSRSRCDSDFVDLSRLGLLDEVLGGFLFLGWVDEQQKPLAFFLSTFPMVFLVDFGDDDFF